MGDAIQLILTVALGFVLGVIVLVAALFFGGRWWLKRKIEDIAEQVMESLSDDLNAGELFEGEIALPTPPRVHLQKSDAIQWRDEIGLESATSELRQHGFAPIDDYEIEELPVALRALHDGENRYYAIIYDHQMLSAIFVDLHARLQDGGTLTVSNAPRGEEITTPPTHEKIFLANAEISELCARIDSELALEKTVTATPDDFAAEFEKSYAESMDFQLRRGGPTIDEIRRGAELRGQTVDEATLGAAHRAAQEQFALQAEMLMRDAFLEHGNLSAAEWENLRDNLIVIHDNHAPDRVIHKVPLHEVDDKDFDYEAYEAKMKLLITDLPAREAFALLIAQLPIEQRPRLVGQLNEPVPSDFYTENVA